MTIDSTERDARIEAKFLEWNLQFRFEPAFPIDKMRVADWAQVRDGANVAPKDSVEEYRMHMAQGIKFGPVVLMDPDVLVDGNTRIAAAKQLHFKTHPAYIGEFPSVELGKAFGAALNQMNGRRLTPEEAAESARAMMARNQSNESIAKELGRSVEQVRRIRSIAEFQAKAASLDLSDKVSAMRVDDTIALNGIKHSAPLAAAIALVSGLRPSRTVVKDLVKKIEAAPSDADALDVVAQAKADLRPAGPPPHRPSAPPEVRQLNMAIGQIISLGANPLLLLDMRPDTRADSIDKVRLASDVLGRVLDAYGARALAKA